MSERIWNRKVKIVLFYDANKKTYKWTARNTRKSGSSLAIGAHKTWRTYKACLDAAKNSLSEFGMNNVQKGVELVQV